MKSYQNLAISYLLIPKPTFHYFTCAKFDCVLCPVGTKDSPVDTELFS